jgi:membrane protease YdiL (CAAX protease family)
MTSPPTGEVLVWLLAGGMVAVATRSLVAVASGALLYLVLAEPGEPLTWQPLRRLAFAALGVFIVFQLTQPNVTRPGDPGRAFDAYQRGALDARLSFTTSRMLRGETVISEPVSPRLLRAAVRQYERATRAYPSAATYHRELAVLYAVQRRWPEAQREGETAARLAAERGSPSAAAEYSFWHAAAGTEPPGVSRLPGLERDLAAVPLGWFRGVLRYALDERLGRTRAAEAELHQVASAANDYALRLMILLFLRLALTALGAILLVVLGVLVRTGVLAPQAQQWAPVSAVLWEGFLLYMFISLVPSLPGLLARWFNPGGERTPGMVVATALLSDSLSVAAVAYLAWRLRGRGRTLADIGLHGRQLGQNVLCGIAAYVATTPILLVAVLVTEQLTKRFFPSVAPPYHPIQGLMLPSNGPWVRAGLFALAAVGAPVFEEIFFRGALHGALRRRLGGLAGALLSATVFAILHPQLPLGFVPIFLLGLSFSLLYEWRGSLVPGMVMHACNNGVVFLLLTAMFPAGG